MKVPLLDLKRQYKYLKNDILPGLNELMEAQTFILGEPLGRFERAIGDYFETEYALGVASGTDALILALDQAGVKPGDEVITTPFTFFATAGAITRLGAIPVFVDINPSTYNMDVNLIAEKITSKTKAILPVHLFGQSADMDFIMKVALEHNLKVIEDACQAIGATYKGNKSGTIGDFGAFSFFPSKNLGGFGDGGMITVKDYDDYKRLKAMRMHGETKKYSHDFVGYNSRLDSLQAFVLEKKLKYLNNWHEMRRDHAQKYNAAFKERGLDEFLTAPYESSVNYHIYNQYTIRTKQRDDLKAFLDEQGIGNAIYYPIPLHLQKCFEHLGYKNGDLPDAEAACLEVLSLPVFPELTSEEQEAVICALESFFKGNRK